jgi:phage shock protein PspC (stress-responsive transcriptional regulator)
MLYRLAQLIAGLLILVLLYFHIWLPAHLAQNLHHYNVLRSGVDRENNMSTENLFESIKENLNGRDGQPIVLGVCSVLARRFEQEVWIFRAVTIVLGVFFTFFTLVAYILLGLFMPETEERTKGLFKGLGIWAQEVGDKCMGVCRDLFGHNSTRNGTP